jgi:hypothetical protein
MLGHQVTSPLLFGIASQNGFSSNADELRDSFILFENMVIRPYRELLTDAFDEILAFNEVSLNLYFKTLKPLEFTDLETSEQEEQEEDTSLNLKKDFSNEEGQHILDNLEGEMKKVNTYLTILKANI